MSRRLSFHNRQRIVSLQTPLLRRLTRTLLAAFLGLEEFDLGIYFVRAPEMAGLNKTHLGHDGSTDVITFSYSDPVAAGIHGEIFICVDDAIHQARRFRTTWQSELVRYLIHGILHLRGFDDLKPAARRAMKREENRRLKEISRAFPLSKLGRASRLAS